MYSLPSSGGRQGLVAVACLMLGACASVRQPPPALGISNGAESNTTFVLVPHAETAEGGQDDPPLSDAGQRRAQDLPRQLASDQVIAIYVDEFRRTQDTARPTLDATPGLSLQHYFSRGPLEDTARQWLVQSTPGTVVVVGEPEAIAPLADTLCDCRVRPLEAGETDRLIRIHRGSDGLARVSDGRYGVLPP